MGKLNAILTGAVVGAGAMYFFDPRLGNRRRTLAQDQFRRLSRKATAGLDAAIRDLGNRAQGLVAEAEAMAFRRSVSDDVLCQRVRSVAGRHMSNVSALEVDAADGCVTLCGPILASEAPGLIAAVRWTRGVRSVDNQLDVHGARGDIAALQGQDRRPGSSIDVLQENWTPGTRLIAGTVGSLLLANCAACRGSLGSLLLGTVGLGLVTRSLVNTGRGQTLGLGGVHRTGMQPHAAAARQNSASAVGSSAPAGDTPALVPRGEEETLSRTEEAAWPPSPMAEPRPAQHTGPFPPAM